MKAAPPRGVGLVHRPIPLVARDIVWLGGVLLGEDGLASLHEDIDGSFIAVTTESRAAELDAWLDELFAAEGCLMCIEPRGPELESDTRARPVVERLDI